MKTTSLSLIALGTILTVGPSPAFAQSAGDSTTVVAILKKYAQTPQLSPALEEIVKLAKAGVSEPIMIAFIQTSPTAYTLNAQDVIQLQRQGVSAQVTTALMQHGEELRRTEAESSKPDQTAALAVASQTATPAVSASTPATVAYEPAPAYPTSTVSVTYFGSPSYSYAPAYYYGYGGGYYPASAGTHQGIMATVLHALALELVSVECDMADATAASGVADDFSLSGGLRWRPITGGRVTEFPQRHFACGKCACVRPLTCGTSSHSRSGAFIKQ